MPQIYKDGIKFDSELELAYYEHLQYKEAEGVVLNFIYHPCQIPNLVGKRSYTPDFIVIYEDRVEIVETKGFNPYSKRIDDAIHEVMKSKPYSWLNAYAEENGVDTLEKDVVYRKYKYLKACGFVDWDFKNPNTIANKRKEKILEQKDEIRELINFKKKVDRYYSYLRKIKNNEKLTKIQKQWIEEYKKEMDL